MQCFPAVPPAIQTGNRLLLCWLIFNGGPCSLVSYFSNNTPTLTHTRSHSTPTVLQGGAVFSLMFLLWSRCDRCRYTTCHSQLTPAEQTQFQHLKGELSPKCSVHFPPSPPSSSSSSSWWLTRAAGISPEAAGVSHTGSTKSWLCQSLSQSVISESLNQPVS